ncbi:hypothetical protein DIJ61_32220 [Burkholderia pseudomallei]|nr:hypothetical protein DIJ61_32220 [Burkholderia pseudomallei]
MRRPRKARAPLCRRRRSRLGKTGLPDARPFAAACAAALRRSRPAGVRIWRVWRPRRIGAEKRSRESEQKIGRANRIREADQRSERRPGAPPRNRPSSAFVGLPLQ